MGRDGDGTEKRVVENCNTFLDVENSVECIETTQHSQTNTAGREKLYWKGGRVLVDIGRLYKLYLPLTCKQFLMNVLTIIQG